MSSAGVGVVVIVILVILIVVVVLGRNSSHRASRQEPNTANYFLERTLKFERKTATTEGGEDMKRDRLHDTYN